jgi:hypothetical protein
VSWDEIDLDASNVSAKRDVPIVHPDDDAVIFFSSGCVGGWDLLC